MSRRPKSTRAEQFSAKVHALKEIFKRLDRKLMPLPTGNDVANVLKYFEQTLMSLVKETRPQRSDDGKTFKNACYPSMDYTGLYTALGRMIKVVPNVELGVEAFAQSLLSIFASLLPFLSENEINSLPMTVASTLMVWPHTVHQHVINLLSGYIIPMCLGVLVPKSGPFYAALNCPALIMVVLQFCPTPKQHAQLLESLMRVKRDVCCDLLAVLSFGPQVVLNPAAQILLHYYPVTDIGGTDDWQFNYEPWHPKKCQVPDCPSPNNTAQKICLDVTFASATCGMPPPVFLCCRCAEKVDVEAIDQGLLTDIVEPVQAVSVTCDNEMCKSANKTCVSLCFAPNCIRDYRYHPLALCGECNSLAHRNTDEAEQHVVQLRYPDPWGLERPEQAYLTEAVIRLLQEAKPAQGTRYQDMGLDKDLKAQLPEFDDEVDNDVNNRRMLSRFSVWLLVGCCDFPIHCSSPERLGRLVSMVMDWMDAVSSLKRDYVGELLKTLANKHVKSWLIEVRANKMSLFCACLSPCPPDYVRVAGCWNMLMNRVRQHMEGLHRLCRCISYDLINTEVWENIMPLWMEAIKSDVPPEELGKFKTLLCNLFDPVLSPFRFSRENTLGFVKRALESAVPKQLFMALSWLQIISQLNLVVKPHVLLTMFIHCVQTYTECSEGISTMFPFPVYTGIEPLSPTMESPPTSATNVSGDLRVLNSTVSCFIMMLDLLVKQISIQFQREGRVLKAMEREDIKRLLKLMLEISWGVEHGSHTEVCEGCDMTNLWFKLAFVLLDAVFPQATTSFAEEDTLNAVAFGALMMRSNQASRTASFKSTESRVSRQTETIDEEVFSDEPPQTPVPTVDSLGGGVPDLLVPESGTVTSQPDTPSDATDLAMPFSSLQSMTGSIGSWRSGASSSSWNTVFENYPQLQLLMGLLKELPKQEDHNVQLNVLKCLKVLVLRGDYLRVGLMADVDFLAYLQEVFFVPNLWGLLQAEHSELSNLCVQVLLHNICLPFGAEKLCDEVEKAITDDDWRERFAAVEKITVLARFLDKENVKTNNLAMSALAHCFTYLVGAVEDVCAPVAVRAVTLLDTVKASSLKILYKCIEHQYDAVPRDRLLLIHTCRILHRVIPHYTPLCGQFFVRRFKHLLIENADFVSVGGPRSTTGSPHGNPSGEASGDSAKRPPVLSMWSRSQSSRSFMLQSGSIKHGVGGNTPRLQSRAIADCVGGFRCNYNFRFAGDKPSYNCNVPGSSEGGSKGSTGSRQRRTGGLSMQQSSTAADIVDKMFLGGRIQKNLPTVVEEECNVERETASKRSSVESNTTVVQEIGNMEAEATYQLVTLVMDFLAYPRGNKSAETVAVFVKTENYEIITMSHYLGVLMGYDIKVGEFTGDPRRLRMFPVFNAYLAGIVQVLDQNQEWGSELLNLTLQLLLFCAAPKAQKRIKTPVFTLVRLPQHTRRIWLTTCLIIVYKYPFHHDSHKRDTRNLIHVVMNTLDAQDHDCPGPTSEPAQAKEANTASRTSLYHLLDTPGEGTNPQGMPERVGSPRLRRMVSDTQSSAGSLQPQDKDQEEKCTRPSSRTFPSREGSTEEENKRTSLSIIHETSVVGPEVIVSEAVIIETARVETVKTAVGGTKVTRISSSEEKDIELAPTETSGKKPQKADSSGDSKDPKGLSTSLEEQKSCPRPNKLLVGSPSLRSMDRFLDGVQEKDPDSVDKTFDYCPECGVALEEFDEETMNLCIVVLSTFVNQSPSMAMPLLPRMFQTVARKCVFPLFPWQNQSMVLVPGSNTEVAKQFFRCVLIKLAPHGVFSEIFRTVYKDSTLLKAIAVSLNGFPSFDQMSPVAYLLQDVLGSRTLEDRVTVLLSNLATYLSFASKEPTSAWESQLSHFETFFRKLPKALQDGCDMTPALKIMASILDAANNSFKGLLPHFGQIVSYVINKCSFQLQDLLELCMKCTETFPKEHNKLFLTRTVVLELVAAVKFKSWLPDANLQLLLQFLAVDAGSRIYFGGEGDTSQYELPHGGCTRAMDCVQQHMTEAVEFIKDWHFVARSNNENRRLSNPNLNFETLPIHMKAGMAQLVALEITKHPKESKIYSKALGWLKHPPSSTQLGWVESDGCCFPNYPLVDELKHKPTSTDLSGKHQHNSPTYEK